MVGLKHIVIVILLVLLGFTSLDGLGEHRYRLRPISGDCNKLTTLVALNPIKQITGRRWVVVTDSDAETPVKTCAVFRLWREGKILRSQETVYNPAGELLKNVTMSWKPDEKGKGFYTDGKTAKAVLFIANKRASGMCFIKCSPMEKGFGGHAFCGTSLGHVTDIEGVLFDRVARMLPKVGVNLALHDTKIDCPFTVL